MIPPLLIGLGVQAWLKRTFAKDLGIEVSSGLNGAAVARQILEAQRPRRRPRRDVAGRPARITTTRGRRRSSSRSPSTSRPRSPLQRSPPMKRAMPSRTQAAMHRSGSGRRSTRQSRLPRMRGSGFCSPAPCWGAQPRRARAHPLRGRRRAPHRAAGGVQCTRRAAGQLRELGLVSAGENEGVQSALNAAALTYVAGALAALSLLLYYALVFSASAISPRCGSGG